MFNIPNTLSLFRLLLGFYFPFSDPKYWLLIVLIAGVTEWLDGYWARRFNKETELGVFLDPLADKTFIIGVVIAFWMTNILNLIEIFLLGFRGFTILAGMIWVGYKRQWSRIKNMKPLFSGKLATVIQYLLMLSIAASQQLDPILLYATILVSIWSGWQYIQVFLAEGKKIRSLH